MHPSIPGHLCGLHALDACDPSLRTPAPGCFAQDAGNGPVCGTGRLVTARLGDSPAAALARSFLEGSMEAWRRLECGEAPRACLAALPCGLGVLSLQVSSPTHAGVSSSLPRVLLVSDLRSRAAGRYSMQMENFPTFESALHY